MHADSDWHAVEGVLSKDMATVGEYLQTWMLKRSTTKTVSAVFLNNKEVKRELKVNHNDETLPFCSEPKCLGPRSSVSRSLTYRRHLESLGKKLTSRVALLRRLAGSGWGNNVANSHLSTGPLNKQSSALLSGALVLTCISLILSDGGSG